MKKTKHSVIYDSVDEFAKDMGIHRTDCKFKQIKEGRFNNLIISSEFETNPKKRFPVLLFTPDMKNTINHYHIELTKKEARVLRNWLNKYLDS